jgi:hypothetical protein
VNHKRKDSPLTKYQGRSRRTDERIDAKVTSYPYNGTLPFNDDEP